MKKILFINACVRPQSRTLRLAKKVLEKVGEPFEMVNLEKENIKPLDLAVLNKRDDFVKQNDFSSPMFKYAKQFAQADEIVIAAPYWDLSFPATVRTYIEAITVLGLTFKYTPEGNPKGLCNAKRIIYVTTAGGPIGNMNFGFDYIKALADTFYGIDQSICFKAEKLDVWGVDVESALKETETEIENMNFGF